MQLEFGITCLKMMSIAENILDCRGIDSVNRRRNFRNTHKKRLAGVRDADCSGQCGPKDGEVNNRRFQLP